MGAKRKEQGQSLVEFALLLPVFVIIVMMGLQMGFLVTAYVTVTNAARGGVRYASLNLAATDSDIQTYTRNQMPGFTRKSNLFVSASPAPTRTWNTTVTITATYDLSAHYFMVKPTGSIQVPYLTLGVPRYMTVVVSARSYGGD